MITILLHILSTPNYHILKQGHHNIILIGDIGFCIISKRNHYHLLIANWNQLRFWLKVKSTFKPFSCCLATFHTLEDHYMIQISNNNQHHEQRYWEINQINMDSLCNIQNSWIIKDVLCWLVFLINLVLAESQW